mgnify:CR=1 FL=1
MTFILARAAIRPAVGAALRARSPLVVASASARRRAVSSTSITNNDLPARGQHETGLAQTSSDGVVATHPIDFDVASKIEGNESQMVTVALEPGQVLRVSPLQVLFFSFLSLQYIFSFSHTLLLCLIILHVV